MHIDVFMRICMFSTRDILFRNVLTCQVIYCFAIIPFSCVQSLLHRKNKVAVNNIYVEAKIQVTHSQIVFSAFLYKCEMS